MASGSYRCGRFGNHSQMHLAEPRRVARVNKQLEREIGNLLLYDKVLQKAVCPEKRVGLDSAASAIASVTEVRISNDLQVAKVYVSIFSDAEGKEQAIRQLKKLEGYVRKRVGSSMSLRLTPEIRFVYDESEERGDRVLKLLKQIQMQESGLVDPPPITVPQPPEDFLDFEDDEDAAEDAADEGSDADEDEGFFDEDDEPLSSGDFVKRRSSGFQASVEQADTSFFGFEDPGGAFDSHDDDYWVDDADEADAQSQPTSTVQSTRQHS